MQSVRFRVPFCLGFLWPSPLKTSVTLVKTWCATTVDEHSTNSGPKSAGKVLQFGGSSQVNIKFYQGIRFTFFNTKSWNLNVGTQKMIVCKMLFLSTVGPFSGSMLVFQGCTSSSRWWFQFFFFHPFKLDMIQFDDHIFQMGWFNHHLVVGYINCN